MSIFSTLEGSLHLGICSYRSYDQASIGTFIYLRSDQHPHRALLTDLAHTLALLEAPEVRINLPLAVNRATQNQLSASRCLASVAPSSSFVYCIRLQLDDVSGNAAKAHLGAWFGGGLILLVSGCKSNLSPAERENGPNLEIQPSPVPLA